MKIIYTLLIGVLLISCQADSKKSDAIRYYDFSIHDVIANEIKAMHSVDDSFAKVVLYKNSKIEKRNIAGTDLISDLESFQEFDLNKAAWQNSYVKTITDNHTRYLSNEAKLTMKYIDIYGDEKNPTRVQIYFQNTNNLYESSKFIVIEPGKFYSIFSLQDVKGMSADTLFIKTFLN